VIPHVFAIGGALVDNVVAADGTLTLDLLGGNALYAAAGARLFAPWAGAVARVPGDYPRARAQAELGEALDLAGLRVEAAASAAPEWFFHAADGTRRDHLHGPSSMLATHGLPQDRLSPVQAAALIAVLEARAGMQDGYSAFRARHPVRPEDVPSAWWQARGLHLCANAVPELIACARAARAAGLCVTLDPGFRAAELGTSELAALLDLVDAFLPSAKELAVLRPGLAYEAALASLGAGRRCLVGVKRGAEGALLRLPGDGALRALPALPVIARDPVGAGDAFCGAFLTGLADAAGPEEALRRAVTAGARAAETSGVGGVLAAIMSGRPRP
jgi:sugar/nucleoside kinase (ribokinase family)